MKIAQLMTGRPRRAHRLPALALPDLAALFEPQADVSLGSVSESNRPATTSLSEHGRPPQKALHLGSIGFPAAASNHTPLPTYSETRVWGFGLADETRIEIERSVSTGTTWACGSRSGRTASGSGEFRIFDPAGNALSTSAYGWTRLFQGREYIPMLDAYDFRARTLWPELGRFGQEDPAGTVDSTNRYQAFGGRWNGLVDPTGFYQADVHRVLTEYLARASGFNEVNAREIAAADSAVDRNPSTRPETLALHGDVSGLMRDHFVVSPGETKVTRDSPAARARVRDAQSLKEFGAALHAWQDSYSHEGAYVGNVRDQVRKAQRPTGGVGANEFVEKYYPQAAREQAIGHPARPEIGSAAGNTYTDLTYRDPQRALEMARGTYDWLIERRVRVGSLTRAQADMKKAEWSKIEGSVWRFCVASSRKAKKAWMNQNAPYVILSDEEEKDLFSQTP